MRKMCSCLEERGPRDKPLSKVRLLGLDKDYYAFSPHKPIFELSYSGRTRLAK